VLKPASGKILFLKKEGNHLFIIAHQSTSFGVKLNVLHIFFFFRVDWTKRSVAKSQKGASWVDAWSCFRI